MMFEILYMFKTKKIIRASTALVAANDLFDAVSFLYRNTDIKMRPYLSIIDANQVPDGEVYLMD